MNDEVKTAIKESVEAGNEELKTQIETQTKTVEELTEKVKTLEERPIVDKGVGIIIPKFYRGRKLSKQFEAGREVLKDDAMAEIISRTVIDLAEAGLKKQQIDFAATAEAHLKAIAPNNETGAESGGNLVLDEFDDVITQLARENSVMIPLVDNVSVGMTDTLKINSQSRSPVLSWDNEGTVTATSAGYGQDSISIKRLSGYVSITNELLADNVYDIVGDITNQFGYGLGQELDKQILSGTGSPVSGVTTAAAGYSVVMTRTGSEAFSSVTGDDYSLAIEALTTVDSANGTFVLGKKAAHYVRTLKDTAGNPVYQAVAGPNLATIFGSSFVIANNITSTSAAATAYAAFGDWKQFILANRMGNLELFVDPYSDSVSYNTRFIYATRKGLGYRRANAFVRLMTYDV